MKKTLCLVLALCLMLAAVPSAWAESADSAAAPQIGDVIYGFEAIDAREFPLIGAQVTLFEHQKTGAKLYYIANDDINRTFELVFKTDAIDDTGLPHVFEHSTLSGSEKYPSAALFFNLIYQTYQTFMNAFTYDRMTAYPVASLSEAQLLRFADFYIDSCFHPNIMTDESIYRTEAWRYRMADAESDLTLEGTVYSEMLGAFDLASASYYNILNTIFQGSTIANESGGHPDHIPEMTYESLKAFHDKYYHPSNCIACLYGDFEDYTAFLKLLDEEFSQYERVEFTRTDEGYQPLSGSLEPITIAYPAEAGSPTDNEAEMWYAIMCPGLPTEDWNKVDTLLDCVTAEQTEFYQRFSEKYPTASISAYLEPAGPEPVVLFDVANINVDDVEDIRAMIDEAIADAAENGFPTSLIETVIANNTLSTGLIREGDDVGVNIISSMMYSNIVRDDPWAYITDVAEMDMIEGWNNDGVFSKLAADYLCAPGVITAVVTTYPEPGLKEQKDAELAAKLAEIKAGMSEEEIAAIVASSNEEQADDDASEYVAQLQAVTVDSLPEEKREYEVTDTTDEDGVRHVNALASVDGIGNANLFFDASGLDQDQILWFKLYVSLLGSLDTTSHTKAEITELWSRYLYSGDMRVSLLGDAEDAKPHMRVTWISTDDDLATGYDTVYEIMYQTKFDNVDQLLAAVREQRAACKNNMLGSPYLVGIYRAASHDNALIRYMSYVNYIEYYEFLGQVEEMLQADPETVTSQLVAVQDYFNNRQNAIAVFAGNEESVALNDELAAAFLAKLDIRPIEPKAYDLPVAADNEAVIMDMNIAFNGLSISLVALGIDEFTGDMDAVTSLVTDNFLIPLLRDQYGVYSVFHGADEDLGMYIVTYRDPNVAETFTVYEQIPELLSGIEVDQETLNGYILSAYVRYAMPAGELTGAVAAAVDLIAPSSAVDVLEMMKQLKSLTPETFAAYNQVYADLIANGYRFTEAGASMINPNADLYDAILNPFGAIDTSEVAFDDLPEDHPQYDVVRYAYENGYLAPVSDTTFGVDQTATYGDLLDVIWAEVGQPAELVGPVEFATTYGIVPQDVDVEAPLTDTEAAQALSTLISMLGMSWTTETEGVEMTRGDLCAMAVQMEEDLAAQAA